MLFKTYPFKKTTAVLLAFLLAFYGNDLSVYARSASTIELEREYFTLPYIEMNEEVSILPFETLPKPTNALVEADKPLSKVDPTVRSAYGKKDSLEEALEKISHDVLEPLLIEEIKSAKEFDLIRQHAKKYDKEIALVVLKGASILIAGSATEITATRAAVSMLADAAYLFHVHVGEGSNTGLESALDRERAGDRTDFLADASTGRYLAYDVDGYVDHGDEELAFDAYQKVVEKITVREEVQVRATLNALVSAWDNNLSGEEIWLANDKPSFDSPANNAVLTQERPTFQYDLPANALGEYIELIDVTEGKAVAGGHRGVPPAWNLPLENRTWRVPAIGSTFNGIPFEGLLNGHQYQLKIRAEFAGPQYTDESLFFTTNIPVITPHQTSFTYPGHGSTVSTSLPTFRWNAATGARKHRIQIKKQMPDGTRPVIVDEEVFGTSFTPADSLGEGTFWVFVTGINQLGQAGPMSSTRDFYINVPTPTAPSLKTPAHVSRTTDLTPHFSWNAATHAAEYELLIKKRMPNGAIEVFDRVRTNQTYYNPPEPLGVGSYWYFIAGVNDAGELGPQSGRDFFIDSRTPAKIAMLFPPHGQTIADTTPQFSWPESNGAFRYELMIKKRVNGVTTELPRVFIENGGRSYTPPTSLGEGTFWVFIRGINEAGTAGPWSDNRDFFINVPVPGATDFITPAFGTIDDDTPTFSWNTATNAAEYRLIIKKLVNGVMTELPPVTTTETTYTPPTSLGEGSFWATIQGINSEGELGPASITRDFRIDINNAPTATLSSVDGTEDQVVNFNLTGQDNDGDNLTYTITQFPQIFGTTQAQGTLTCSAAGVCIYNPTFTTPFNTPNFQGAVTFKYRVSDGQENSEERTVTIHIANTQDPPVIVPNSTTNLNEDAFTRVRMGEQYDIDGEFVRYTIQQPANGRAWLVGDVNGSGTFTSLDALLILNAIQHGGPTGDDRFIMDINGDGNVNQNDVIAVINFLNGNTEGDGILGGGAILGYRPDPNFNGTDTVSFTATDNVIATPLAGTATFNVFPTPDPITLVEIPNQTVQEDAADRTINLNNHFSDPDSALTYTIVGNTNSSIVSTSQTGTNGENLILDFLPNQHGTADITVQACDASNSCITDVFRVTITPVNDAPEFTINLQPNPVIEDQPSTFTLPQLDPDGEVITYSISGQAGLPLNGASRNVTGGTVSCTGPTSGTFNCTFNPTPNFHSTDHPNGNITVSASEPGGMAAAASTVFFIQAVNDTPTVTNIIPDRTVNEDAVNTVINLNNHFNDVESALTYTVITNTNSGIVTTGVSGSTLTLDYQDNQSGISDITVRACDPSNACVTDTFRVTINAVNDTPTVTTIIPDRTVNEDAPNVVINLNNHFSDVESGLTYTVTANTNSGIVSTAVNGANLTLDYLDDKNGISDITVRACDTSNSCVTDTFRVTINAVNDDPIVSTPLPDRTVQEDAGNTVINLNDHFSDPESALTYTVTGNTNFDIVTTGVSGSTLTLDYQDDKNGTSDITVRACDTSNRCVTDTFRVTINAVADNPVIEDTILIVNEDIMIAFGIPELNVSDPDNPANDPKAGLRITAGSLVVGPSNGTVNVVNGEFQYMPDPNFTGMDSFTYAIRDAEDNMSNIGTVRISVQPLNDKPVATLTDVNGTEDQFVDFNLTGTDVDNPQSGLTFRITEQPTDGVLQFNGMTGAARFIPNPNFFGDVTFKYVVNDGTVDSDEVTVTISVANVDDDPTVSTPIPNQTAQEDAGNTTIDLSNHFNEVDGQPLTYSVTNNTNTGLVTTGVSGNNLTLDFQDDQNGTADITVRACDNSTPANCLTDTFRVTVNPVDDDPTVTVTAIVDNEDTTVFFNLPRLDPDGEEIGYVVEGQTVTIASNNIAISIGTLSCAILNATTSRCSIVPTANLNGVFNIPFTYSDPSGPVKNGTIPVTLLPQEDEPIIPFPQINVVEDTPTNFNLPTTDGDGDPITYTVDGNPLPTNGTPVNTPAGTIVCNVNGSTLNCTLTPNPNVTGTINLPFTGTDPSGPTQNTTVPVVIAPVDDDPVVSTPIADVTVTENDPDTIIDLSNHFDELDGQPLTYSVTLNTNTGLVATSVNGNNLTLDYQTDQNGTANITVQACDNSTPNKCVTDSFLVTVEVGDNAPELTTPIDDVTVQEDAADTTIDLGNHFNELDGQPLTYSITSNTNNGLVTTGLSGDDLTLDYQDNQNGISDITVQACDDSTPANCTSDTFRVTVNAVDDTPEITTPIADVTVNEDAADQTIDLGNHFSELDGQPLTYTIALNTNTGLVTTNINGDDLTLDFLDNQNGTANVTVQACDNSTPVNCVSDAFVVTVNSVEDEPIIPTTQIDVVEDTPTNFTLPAVDGDGDNISYTIDGTALPTDGTPINTPAGQVSCTLSGNDLSCTLTPAPNNNGNFTLAVTGTDADGPTQNATIPVVISAVDDAPVVTTPIADVTVQEDAVDTVVDLSNHFNELDGQPLTYSVTLNTNGTLVTTSVSGDQLTLDYQDNQNGVSNITVEACDNSTPAKCVSDTFVLTVNAVNDTPELTTPIPDVSVDEDAPNTTIDLSNHFTEPDGQPLTHNVLINTNTGLVATSINGDILTLDYADNLSGISLITILSCDDSTPSNCTTDVFMVTVNAVDDDPVVTTPIADVTVNEDAGDTTIDLSNHFNEVDGQPLTYSVSMNTNTGIVNTSISGDVLTLDYIDNQNGVGMITVEACDNSTPANCTTDTFVLGVLPVDDAPELTTPLADVTVDEDAADSTIDLSNHFTDIDGTITYTVTLNTNSGLVTTAINSNDLTLDFLDNQNGTANITVEACSSGQCVSDSFLVTVNAVDDDPAVTTPIADVTVNEDAGDTTIDLSNHFNELDGQPLTYTVTANTNTGLVTTSISGNDLTLDYLENQNGTADITVQACDNSTPTNCSTDAFTVTVNSVEDEPIIPTTQVDVTENQPANFTLPAVDGDGDTITYTLDGTQLPTDGTPISTSVGQVSCTISGNNLACTLVPTTNLSGSFSLPITATDADGPLQTANLPVEIVAVDDVPVVTAPIDDVAVNEDATDTTIDLSAHFDELDGQPLTYTITTNTNGTLVTTSISGSDLTLDYQDNQNGTSDITVQACDNSTPANCITDTFMVTVNAVDDAPELTVPISDLTVDEDAPDTTIDLDNHFTEVDGQSLTYALLSNTNTGLVASTLNGDMLTLDYLDNQSGLSLITVVACDSTMPPKCTTDVFMITVNPVDDAPVLTTPLADVTVDENAPDTVVDLSNHFNEIEGQPISYSVTLNTNNSLVTTAISGDQLTLDYQLNQSGTANITVQACDDSSPAQCTTDSFLVTVNSLDDEPVIPTNQINVTEDQTENFDIPAVDPGGETITYTFDGTTLPTDGTPISISIGILTCSVSGNDLDCNLIPTPNLNGNFSIPVTATDPDGPVQNANIPFSIAAVDDDPVVSTPIADVTVDEDAADSTIDLSNHFNEVDGQPLTYTVTTNTNTGLVTTSISGNDLTLDFLDDQNGTSDITVQACDDSTPVNCISDTFTVTVNSVEDEPIIPTTQIDVVEDTPTNFTLPAVDGDGQPVTYTLGGTTLPTDGTPISTPAGQVSCTVSGNDLSCTLTPDPNVNGSITLPVTATDADGPVQNANIPVEISAVDDAPEVTTPIADVTVDEDAVDSTIDLSNHFNEVEGQPITYTVTANTNTGLVSTSVSGNDLTLDFLDNQNGTSDITVRACDDSTPTNCTTDTFTVTVNPVEDEPIIPTTQIDVVEDTPTNFTLPAVDGDGQPVTYTLGGTTLPTDGTPISTPAGQVSCTVSGNDLSCTLTPDPNVNGSITLPVTATDADGPVQNANIPVEISAVDDAPEVTTPIADVTVDEDAADSTIDLSNHFNEVDGQPLAYTVTVNTNTGLVTTSISGNDLTLDFLDNQNGTGDITVQACDNSTPAKCVTDTFTVTVNAVDDAPEVTTPIADVTVDEDAVDSTIDLSNHFNELEGQPIAYTVTVNTNTGLVSTSVSGNDLTLDFLDNQNGTSDITVQACDDSTPANCTTDTFTVTVNSVEDEPIIPTTQIDVVEDTPTNFTLPAVDGDGQPVTYTLGGTTLPTDGTPISTPAGQVSCTVSGNDLSCTLTPDPNVNGSIMLPVTATDPDGPTQNANIPVVIAAVDDAPVVTTPISDVTVDQDAPDTIIDLSNHFNEVEGQPITYTVTVNTNTGLVTTSVSGNDLTLDYQAGQTGTSNITVQACDNSTPANCTTDTFLVTVNSPDADPIVSTPIADVTVDEDAADSTIDLSNHFNEPDGQPLTYTVTGNTAGSLVSTSVSGNNLTLDFLDNQNGTSDITVQACDDSSPANCVTDTFAVTVNPVDDNPILVTPIADVTVNEDAPDTVIDLTNHFNEPDGQPLSYTISLDTLNSLVVVSESGNDLILDYVANANGSTNVTVEACDNSTPANCVSDTFLVTVNPVDDEPIIPTTQIDVVEDTPTNFTLPAVDGDGQPVTYTLGGTTLPTDGTLISTPAGQVSCTVSGNDLSCTLTPDPNVNGSITLPVTATDADGPVQNANIPVVISAVDDAPEVTTPIADVTVDEDAADSTIDLSQHFNEIEGQPITYTVTANTNTGLVSTSVSGNDLTLDFLDNQNGTSDITVQACDDSTPANCTTDTFTVTVNPVEDRPELTTPIEDITVNEDAPDTVIDLTNHFTELDGQPMTFTIIANSNPTVIFTSVNGNDLTLDYQANLSGISIMTVQACDNASPANCSTDVFMVTVNPVDDAPVVTTPIADVTVDEDAADSAIDLSQHFNEIEGQAITYTVTGNTTASLVSTSVSGNDLTLDFLDNQNGTSDITVQACDDSTPANCTTDTFTVTVNPVDDNPILVTPIADVTVNEDAPDTVIDLTNHFNEPDGQPFTYTVTTNTNTGLVSTSFSGDDLTLDFLDNQNGTGDITVQACDNSTPANCVSDTFTVTVNSVEDEPIIPTTQIDVVEDTPKNFDLPGVDGDGDPITYTIGGTPLPTDGTPISTVAGDLSCTLNVTVLNCTLTPTPNANGPFTLVVTATDGDGPVQNANIPVVISAVDDAPVVTTPIADVTEDEDAADVVIDLGNHFNEVEGQPITYTVTTNTNNTLLSTSISGEDLTLDFLDNQNGTADITVQACDDSSPAQCTTDTFTVTVNPVDDEPLVGGTIIIDEGDVFIGDFPLTDVDGDPVTYTNGGVTNGTLDCRDIPAQGIHRCTYTPPLNYNGTEIVDVTATDDTGPIQMGQITIIVQPLNDLPTGDDQQVATPKNVAITTQVGTDVDGDTLTITIPDQGDNGTAVCSQAVNSGVTEVSCTYTPNNDFVGMDQFQVTMTDASGSKTVTIDVDVQDTEAPVINVSGLCCTNDPANYVLSYYVLDDVDARRDVSVTGTALENLRVPNGPMTHGINTFRITEMDSNGNQTMVDFQVEAVIEESVLTVPAELNGVAANSIPGREHLPGFLTNERSVVSSTNFNTRSDVGAGAGAFTEAIINKPSQFFEINGTSNYLSMGLRQDNVDAPPFLVVITDEQGDTVSYRVETKGLPGVDQPHRLIGFPLQQGLINFGPIQLVNFDANFDADSIQKVSFIRSFADLQQGNDQASEDIRQTQRRLELQVQLGSGSLEIPSNVVPASAYDPGVLTEMLDDTEVTVRGLGPVAGGVPGSATVTNAQRGRFEATFDVGGHQDSGVEFTIKHKDGNPFNIQGNTFRLAMSNDTQNPLTAAYVTIEDADGNQTSRVITALETDLRNFELDLSGSGLDTTRIKSVIVLLDQFVAATRTGKIVIQVGLEPEVIQGTNIGDGTSPQDLGGNAEVTVSGDFNTVLNTKSGYSYRHDIRHATNAEVITTIADSAGDMTVENSFRLWLQAEEIGVTLTEPIKATLELTDATGQVIEVVLEIEKVLKEFTLDLGFLNSSFDRTKVSNIKIKHNHAIAEENQRARINVGLNGLKDRLALQFTGGQAEDTNGDPAFDLA